MGSLSSKPGFLVLAVLLSSATSVWAADTATRCCATRLRVSGVREKQLFRCHARAAAIGSTVDAACIAAAGQALTRSFDRSECPAPSDADSVRAVLERLVSAAAAALRPTSTASTCAARKLKAAGRLVASAARALSRFAPKPADHLGELDPIVTGLLLDLGTTFARLETRSDCLTSGDATTVGSPLMAGQGPIPPDGLLLVSLRLCPACGDFARGGTEECDGFDQSACNGPCRPDCTCPACGDGVKNQTTEDCDGADAGACQGLCQADCTCPTPVCGNGVTENGEACDGADLGACGSSCQPDCTCGAVCGYPCYQFGCCDPDEVCMPSPSTGYCFKFRCDPGEPCNFGYECVQSPDPIFGTGYVCAGEPGSACFLPDFSGGVILPCVPPSGCVSGRCCLPTGESCSRASACCSGTCNGGTCS